MCRRVEAQAADLDRQVGAASLDQSAQARHELGERERLCQVVVAAGGEAGQPVGERIAGREEDHRRADSLGAKRLDDVTAVRVGQADVDDERVRIGVPDPAQQLGCGRRGRDLEPLLAQAARDERAELGVVLEQDHLRIDHSVASIALAGDAPRITLPARGHCAAATVVSG